MFQLSKIRSKRDLFGRYKKDLHFMTKVSVFSRELFKNPWLTTKPGRRNQLLVTYWVEFKTKMD